MEADERFITTDSGVLVYRNWQEAVRGIDVEFPAIRMKGDPKHADPKDVFWIGKALGLCKLCSVHSEDALTWVLFRCLDRAGCLLDFLAWCFPQWSELRLAAVRETLYWGRKADEWAIENQVERGLAEFEPYHAAKGRQHTETDFAALLSRMRMPVESKLGTGVGAKSGWEKGKGEIRPEYEAWVGRILREEHRSQWREHMLPLFQPLRQLALAALIEGGDLERVGLLLLVNEPLGPQEHLSHRRAFRVLTTITAVSQSHISLTSWQDILAWLLAVGDERLSSAVAALSENPLVRPPGRSDRTCV